MFSSKKVRVATALVCAIVLVIMNSSMALAASYSYRSVEEIRSKALSNYLSSKGIIAMGSSQTESEEKVTASAVEETVTEEVSYSTIKRLNSSLAAGETVTVREGEMGEKTFVYSVKYVNGKETSREVVSSCITKAPVARIVEYGVEAQEPAMVEKSSSSASADTSKLDYKYYIDCEATAYDMSPEENGGYAGQSATGVPLEKGVIAVDPRVIPLGTRVYVEALDGSWSYGYAVAADTGGAIKGKRVDLCYRTQKECIQFGRRACRVYILN